MSVNDTKSVITPEQVTVTYRLSGLGTRFAAMLVDTFIQVALIVAITLAFYLLAGGDSSPADVVEWEEEASAWIVALTVVVFFGILWCYFIFWETIWNGRTPGKRAAGIRVMRDGGHPMDFRAAFVRNIARYVDFLPFSYGVGALTVFLSRESKRLGDYAAGTIVVVDSSQTAAAPGLPWSQELPYTLLRDPTLLNLRAISRERFGVVEQFLSRRVDLPENVRADLAGRIAKPLMVEIGMEVPAAEDYSYETFLVELARAYRSRSSA